MCISLFSSALPKSYIDIMCPMQLELIKKELISFFMKVTLEPYNSAESNINNIWIKFLEAGYNLDDNM